MLAQAGLQLVEQLVDGAGRARFGADGEGPATVLLDEVDGILGGLLVAPVKHGDQAPSRARPRAVARPIPRLEPVTATVLPLSLRFMLVSLLCFGGGWGVSR
ncbi:hypothetical protein [Streptomyces coeruleorubidus]